jgi:predicted NBD/HSP70 family sugar kinase
LGPTPPLHRDDRVAATAQEVLRALHAYGATPVGDIVRRLKGRDFSREAAAVHRALDALEEHQPPLVVTSRSRSTFHVADAAAARRGRRARWANLSAHWGAVVGVDVGNLVTRAAVTGPDAWPLGGAEQHIQVATADQRAVLVAVANCVRDAVAAAGARDEHFQLHLLRGIAVAMPAPVCVDRQTVSETILPAWRGVDVPRQIKRLLPAALRWLPISVFNEADARTIGEVRVGRAREYDDVLLIKVSHGIGGGAIHGGQLLTGHGSATEIGHIRVEPALVTGKASSHVSRVRPIRDVEDCFCKQPNHLQAHASFKAMANRLDLNHRDVGAQEDIYGEIAKGFEIDDRYTVVVRQSCAFIAQALTTACALLAPAAIVIGGRLADCGDEVVREIDRHMAVPVGRRPELLLASPAPTEDEAALQAFIGVRGAARLAIETFLDVTDRPVAN